MWHKLDRAFSTPRAVMYMRLSSPLLGTSPKAVALNHLMLKWVWYASSPVPSGGGRHARSPVL